MDVQEQSRESTSEIREEPFGHRTDLPLDVIRQVLIMVFLISEYEHS